MTLHEDWGTSAFGLEPAASAVGPFAGRGFLMAWWRHLGAGWKPLLVETPSSLLPLMVRDHQVTFAGVGDLTDYHTPLGEGVEGTVEQMVEALGSGWALSLDSLPWEAATLIEKGLRQAAVGHASVEHQVTAVIDLPMGFAAYLSTLGKSERHELRRKRRRFQEAVGPVLVETHRGRGWAFDQFVALHRMAKGPKGAFLTTGAEAFFADLITQPGWRVDVLRGHDQALACLFGYSDGSGYYLYNSSYHPDVASISPGMVLLAAVIEEAAEEGLPRVDFLKGDEGYKFRLGARRRPLYRIEATT